MKALLRFEISSAILLGLAPVLLGQVATGIYDNGSFDNKGFDTLNVGNLNVHFAIPVFAKTGRGGLNFHYTLTYDSSVWTPVGLSGSQVWQPSTTWGWSTDTAAVTGFITYSSQQRKCYDDPPGWFWSEIDSNFTYIDAYGRSHFFSGKAANCDAYGSGLNALATDGSGLRITATAGGGATIFYPNGQMVVPPRNQVSGSAHITDNNGNQITTNGSSFTDTTGNTVLSLSGGGTSASPLVITYSIPSSPYTASATMHYGSYSVRTYFNCSGVTEYSASGVSLVDYVQLADGETYHFTYETTPNYPGSVTGRLASITLPTGGAISYAYSGGSNGIVCSDGSTAGLTRGISAPSSTSWSYVRTPSTSSSQTLVTDGLSNQSVYNFSMDSTDPNHTMYAYSVQRFQGAATGTPLLSQQTCYNGASDCMHPLFSLPITQTMTTSTLNGTATTQDHAYFNSYGLLTREDISDNSTGTYQGKFVTYASLGNGIVDHISQVQTVEPGGYYSQSVAYRYDESAVSSTSGLPQHVPVSGSRGNITSVAMFWNATGTDNNAPTVVSRYTYDDAGQMTTSSDAAGSITNYTYDSATDTFPILVTMPTTGSTAHTTSAAYDAPSGAITSSTDQNGKTTSYTYDSLLRLATTHTPDAGPSDTTYSNTYALTGGSPYVSTSVLHVSGVPITQTSWLDPYGRLKESESTDVGGDDLIDYTYNSNGKIATVSNPYKSGGTYVTTSYGYDALGRVLTTTAPDSSTSTAAYSGSAATITDATSRSRKIVTDAFGRTSQVFEPDGNGNLTVETDYQYGINVSIGNGTSPQTYQNVITQKGGATDSSQWRVRTFTYDMFGHMIQESTPEAGITNFAFWPEVTACAGDPSLPCSRTDASGTVTTYAYDALNRLIGKSYGGSNIGLATSAVSYFYDQCGYNGLTIANGTGQRTGMSNASGATAWSFDAMGRVAAVRKTINGQTKQANYTYNLDGSVNTVQDYGLNTFTYTYDIAGRQTSVMDNAGNNYASGATYTATGQLASLNHQKTPGAALYARNLQYNNLLQPTLISASLNGNTIQSLSYGYGMGGTNNGNVVGIANNLDNSRSQTFNYDNLNRLISAHDGNHWGESYSYDNWGNLYQTSPISGYTNGWNWNVTADAHNRLSNQSYDAAGEVIQDQLGNLSSYDAEGRLVTAGSGSYTYDGDGNRVKKVANGATTLYWPAASALLNESDGSASIMARQVYLGGVMVYRESIAGTGVFLFQDHLGSTRVTGDAAGNMRDDIDYRPFGTVEANYGSSPSDNHYLFAGDESDASENSTDYAVFRNLSYSMGRFNRPDPYDGSYAPTDPQALNRYSYVANRAILAVDPSGLMMNIPENPPGSAPGDSIDILLMRLAGRLWVSNWQQQWYYTVYPDGEGGVSIDGGSYQWEDNGSWEFIDFYTPAVMPPLDAPNNSCVTGQQILDEAAKWKGTPYSHAKAQCGVAGDCSGTVSAIYSNVGINITLGSMPSGSSAQGIYNSPSLYQTTNPQPGNIVYWSTPFNHVMIYAGNGYAWGARRTGFPFGYYPMSWFGNGSQPTYLASPQQCK